jgi:hypothetical protein
MKSWKDAYQDGSKTTVLPKQRFKQGSGNIIIGMLGRKPTYLLPNLIDSETCMKAGIS